MNERDAEEMTPLENFLEKLKAKPKFDTNKSILMDILYMLDNGFKFNKFVSLSWIIAKFPMDVCRELLNFGIQKLDLVIYCEDELPPLLVAYLMGSKDKSLLLCQKGFRDDDKILENILKTRQVLKKSTDATILLGNTRDLISDDFVLQKVMNCRQFMKIDETLFLVKSVDRFVNVMCKMVCNHFKIIIDCQISGSLKENTRVYMPNEFDFIFEVLSPISVSEKTHEIYTYMHECIVNGQYQFGDSNLKVVSLLRGKGISKIHFIWNKHHYKTFDILCDIAICQHDKIAKYLGYHTNDVVMKATDHDDEHILFNHLHEHLKHGYILAKAVRLAAIAQPKDIEVFDLCENINVDDVITSYMLRACLIAQNFDTSDKELYKTPSEAAIKIYERLKISIHEKCPTEICSETITLFDCTECSFEDGCCKKLKLMSALTENILKWIHKHLDQLNTIDFATDVDLVRDLKLPQIKNHDGGETDSSILNSKTEWEYELSLKDGNLVFPADLADINTDDLYRPEHCKEDAEIY